MKVQLPTQHVKTNHDRSLVDDREAKSAHTIRAYIGQTSELFQALVALLIKLRRANSVRTRGSCSWPRSVARVRWVDISDQWRHKIDYISKISDGFKLKIMDDVKLLYEKVCQVSRR